MSGHKTSMVILLCESYAGPGSQALDTALTFHRMPGGLLDAEWVEDEAAAAQKD